MIILDTNVIFEPMQPKPDARVLAWFDAQDFETLYLTAMTVAEILYGIKTMPDGKRKDHLRNGFYNEVFPLFEGRILPFDCKAADEYAELMAQAKQNGRAIGHNDAYIAAIAKCNNMIVATHDVSPFEAAGLEIISPWTADYYATN